MIGIFDKWRHSESQDSDEVMRSQSSDDTPAVPPSPKTPPRAARRPLTPHHARAFTSAERVTTRVLFQFLRLFGSHRVERVLEVYS